MTQRTSMDGAAPGKTRWPGLRAMRALIIFPIPPKCAAGIPKPTMPTAAIIITSLMTETQALPRMPLV